VPINLIIWARTRHFRHGYPLIRDNTKIDLRETEYEGMNWIKLVLNRDQLRAIVYTAWAFGFSNRQGISRFDKWLSTSQATQLDRPTHCVQYTESRLELRNQWSDRNQSHFQRANTSMQHGHARVLNMDYHLCNESLTINSRILYNRTHGFIDANISSARSLLFLLQCHLLQFSNLNRTLWV
jgi:hypothetical protein